MKLSPQEIRWLRTIKKNCSLLNSKTNYFVSGCAFLASVANFWEVYAMGISYRMPNGTAVLTHGFMVLIQATFWLFLAFCWLGKNFNQRDKVLLTLVEKLASEEDKAEIAKI